MSKERAIEAYAGWLERIYASPPADSPLLSENSLQDILATFLGSKLGEMHAKLQEAEQEIKRLNQVIASHLPAGSDG